MNFNWKLYIDLGKTLTNKKLSRSEPEAYYRSSISRYYYGAFCLARNYLIHIKKLDKGVKGSQVHEEVQSLFLYAESFEEKEIGDALQKLHIHRKKADYDDVIHDIESDLTIAECYINNILDNLAKIDPHYWKKQNICLDFK